MSAERASSFQSAGSAVLAALVFLLPLAATPQGFDPAAAKSAALQAGALLLALFWALKGLERGRWELPSPAKPLLLPAALLFAWTLARFLASPHREAALPGFLHQAAGLAVYAAVMLEAGGTRDASRVSGGLLSAAWVVLLYAGLQLLGLDPVSWGSARGAGSTLADPELLSALLSAAVPLAAARLCDPDRPALLQGADAAFILLSGAAALSCGSPWGAPAYALACLLSAGGLLWALPAKAGSKAAALTALSGLAVLTAAVSIPALQDASAEALARRAGWWSAAVSVARERPWLGAGPGSFWLAAPRVQGPGAILAHAGSEPLELAAELGLPGLALWLWLFAAWFSRLRLARKAFLSRAAWSQSLALAGLAPAVLALLGTGLFTASLRFAAPGWLVWPLAGLAGGLTLLAPRGAAVSALPLPVSIETGRILYAPALFSAGLLFLPASWLASDLRYNAAVSAAREGRWGEAEALAAGVSRGAPARAGAESLAASAGLATGRLEEALASLHELERLAPRYPYLRHREGLAHAGLGDWESARDSHEAQRALDPLFVPNLEGLYTAALALGETHAARRAAFAARAVDPGNPAHLLALARTYRGERRFSLARSLERKAAGLKRR